MNIRNARTVLGWRQMSIEARGDLDDLPFVRDVRLRCNIKCVSEERRLFPLHHSCYNAGCNWRAVTMTLWLSARTGISRH